MVNNNSIYLKEMRWALAFLWLVSALLPFVPSVQKVGLDELNRFGFANEFVLPLMFIAIFTDVLCCYLALCIARPWAWAFQMAVVVSYTLLLSYAHPTLWLDPFGALLKNVPIVTAMYLLMRADAMQVNKTQG